MQLVYTTKKSAEEIKASIKPVRLVPAGDGKSDEQNILVHGENLSVMQALLTQQQLVGKVDLIYIDPPFATNTVFRSGEVRNGHVSHSMQDAIAYSDILVGADYLEFIRERLILLREFLSDQGSIYLHIDYKIGHYVKIIMDEIFGSANFRNDITRIKCNPKNFKRKAYGNIKDMILFYTKTDNYIWNEPQHARDDDEVARLFKKVDAQGRRYTTTPLHAPGETAKGPTGQVWKGMRPPPGRHWRYDPKVLDYLDAQGLIEWSSSGNPRKIVYADEMPYKKLQDIWEFKDPQRPLYPTEKNLEMLKTIISTSSNSNSIVLDAFCGSGGTLIAADSLHRHWIGIDNSAVAIRTTMKRLQNRVQRLFDKHSAFTHLVAEEQNTVVRQVPPVASLLAEAA